MFLSVVRRSAGRVATAPNGGAAQSGRKGTVRSLVGSSRPALANILIGDSTDPVCESVFRSRGHAVDFKPGLSKEELLSIIGKYDGLVVRSGVQVDEDLITAAKNMRIVGRAGTGVDNINVPAATSKGVLVMNTPGGNTVSTAELTMSHILALARNIPQAVSSMKEGRWDRKKYTGTELMGKTIGVVGLGRIGREVATWCMNFGMHAVGYDPILTDDAALAAGIEPVSLDELFACSDFITLHTPLTPETKGLIGRSNLDKCKKGVRIINCARGGIIDPVALVDALNLGKVAGASLDVYPSEPPPPELKELVTHPKVVCSPHLGASTQDAQVRVAKDIAIQMCDVLDGGEYVGVLNAPNMAAARKSKLTAYVSLGERMGALQAQLLGQGKGTLHGKNLGVPEKAGPMSAAVIKGALNLLLAQEVNYVNAAAVAKDTGLAIEVAFSERDPKGYLNGLSVEFEIDGVLNGRRTMTGTCFGTDTRVVDVDGLEIDFNPSGHMLMFNNPDSPGMLRAVAAILGDQGINIASFALGRVRTGGVAMSCLNLDTPCTEGMLEEIRKIPDIRNVVQASIDSREDPSFRMDTDEASQGQVYGTPMPPDKPQHPEFSSGPCKKRPGWSASELKSESLGRSHRSKVGKARLKYAIEESKRILGIPDDYLLGIVPASDTGAYEMAMWSMLGPRDIDSCHWESFGKGWHGDAMTHLGLKDQVTEHTADYGHLPDLSQTNPDSDILFTWNGTTSGVKVPNGDWISDNRTGLTFNDCTSAAFAMDIPWNKCDVSTYSWQKVLGGEGAHGVMVLSPRAVERLESFTPDRPLPKIFRMVKKGKVDRSIFDGSTINTPSMLCVEDYIDALQWCDTVGGLNGLIKRSEANARVINNFCGERDWIRNLAQDPATASNTSVCLTLDLEKDQVKTMVGLLETEGVAFDVGSYRDAPAGLRIWCGATVEKEDVEALMPWLEWAYTEAKSG
ncbi:Phosphoglycerate dehydrogenase / Phosphoserine aminotransferase [Ectocarpus siliculosus]|uniref:D-3-phosphoglycerate dehydrogenase n=1 Tax=Ectocarpus siliculosus TaxID=2880 RepID=D7FLK7_ECTSI|nr:Phosphoglycerate dehydrogenase / Phosphoserine aminotransferase [Ectocarpus siliculosus]|eukprot:CBJ25823.1 Phosphoglycerate dehydrogenase / Phosphoserine aminotransferase [Ectocarpus siliculosus]